MHNRNLNLELEGMSLALTLILTTVVSYLIGYGFGALIVGPFL